MRTVKEAAKKTITAADHGPRSGVKSVASNPRSTTRPKITLRYVVTVHPNSSFQKTQRPGSSSDNSIYQYAVPHVAMKEKPKLNKMNDIRHLRKWSCILKISALLKQHGPILPLNAQPQGALFIPQITYVQMTSSSPRRQRRHAKKSTKQHREPKQLLFATYSRTTPTMIQVQNQEKAALDAANPASLTTLVAQRQMRAHVKYMKHLIQTILLPTHRQAKAVISECPRTTPTMIQVQDQEKAALNAANQGNLTTLVAQRQVRTHVKYMKHLIQTTLLPAVISECQAFNQAVNPLQAQTLPHFLIYPALLNGLA